jgi:osmoprotectant transport system substrate-binding protein
MATERIENVKRIRTLLAVAFALALVAGACGSDDDDDGGTASDNSSVKVTVGAQDFGESKILAEIYAQGLEAKGFDAAAKFLGTNSYRKIEVEAFDSKTINFAPEYAASMLEFMNDKKGEATGDVDTTVAKLETYLGAKSLGALKPSAAVDTNAFVITKKTSDDLGIKSLSDLAAKGKDLKIGAPADCETNPFCIPGLKTTYGLDLSKNVTPLGAEQITDALDANSIQIGLVFSTASAIKTKGYVLLDDDKHMLAADNVVPIVAQDLQENEDLVAAVNAITAKLTTEALIDMNTRFEVDKDDAAVIAKDFLTDEGLI